MDLTDACVCVCLFYYYYFFVPNDDLKKNKKKEKLIQSSQLELHSLKKVWRWNGDFKSKHLMNIEGEEEGQ